MTATGRNYSKNINNQRNLTYNYYPTILFRVHLVRQMYTATGNTRLMAFTKKEQFVCNAIASFRAE